jgi:hypothetical protein
MTTLLRTTTTNDSLHAQELKLAMQLRESYELQMATPKLHFTAQFAADYASISTSPQWHNSVQFQIRTSLQS